MGIKKIGGVSSGDKLKSSYLLHNLNKTSVKDNSQKWFHFIPYIYR